MKIHAETASLAIGPSPVKFAPIRPSSNKHPSNDLYVIGVTGTNGKTTVAYLIGEVLAAAGFQPFVLGTLNSGNRDLSTPEAADVSRFMQNHLNRGGTHFVMEVTSEGICEGRVSGIDFDVKVLTNITQDHLDYHKTFENYRMTKLNFIAEGDAHKVVPETFESTPIEFKTNLLGSFNLANVRAAVSVLRHMGVSEHYISKTLSSCCPPSGRLESVKKGQQFMVLIDYAHTPDGLENVLATLQDIAVTRKGRLLVLFGCGGNRDTTKRPRMGEIASEKSDFLVITDDNPRSENSGDIISQILQGVHHGFCNYIVIQDRRKAIDFIVNKAERNDVVLLAGKGHETYQVTRSGTAHFDDKEEAARAIFARGGRRGH